jgi:chemotaxis protein CheX
MQGTAIALDPVLDLNAAAPLTAALRQHRGRPLRLDASAVRRLGGLCLQVLLAADRAWGEDGCPLAIAPRSAAFDEALALFGASGRFDGNQGGVGA